MRIRELLTGIAAVCLLIGSGCDEEDNTSLLAEQEQRYFDLYIAANYADVDSTESGMYYIEYVEGEGISSDTGQWVLMNYVTYTIPDENVVDTYTEEWAIDHNLYNASIMYGPYKYLHGSGVKGVDEGLSLMKEGGISRMLFKSDLGYGETGSGSTISAYESLMWDVELLEVIGDAAQYEKDQIAEYLAGVTSYVTIPDEETGIGMYYIPMVTGTGNIIAEDSTVEVYYRGSLLDGREFDSNIGDAFGLDVTIGDGSVIKGWEIGLTRFKQGGTGKLLIPHELAYGEDGNILSGTTKYSIPPYEALLFEIGIGTDKIEEVEIK